MRPWRQPSNFCGQWMERCLPKGGGWHPWTEEETVQVVFHLPLNDDHSLVRGVVATGGLCASEEVHALRKKIMEDYGTTVFSGKTTGDPPVRGPMGEAEIHLLPGVRPRKQNAYRLSDEHRRAMMALVDKLIAEGKVEPGFGPWVSPAFPVPKKESGKFRLVVDFCALNEATIEDANPLPRIEDILHRQGNYKMWSVLDMKDGYHQVPLKKEHRNLTCMSTPGVPSGGRSLSWASEMEMQFSRG